MTDYLATTPRLQFITASGAPASGYQLFTWSNNTVTPQTTYTDAVSNVPNTNPIIMDVTGSCDLWLPPGQLFTMAFATPTDTNPPTSPLWVRNNLSSGSNLASLNFGIDTGVANAYVTAIAGITTLSQGQIITLDVANTNTGPSTLNVNGTGINSITLQSGGYLGGGELQANGQYLLQYTGFAWQLLSPSITPDKVITPAEIAAGITPVNFFYPPGKVERYGADPTNTNDSTSAFNNAVAQSAQAGGAPVTFGPGTYQYKPTGTLFIANDFIGAGPQKTSIVVNTSAWTPVTTGLPSTWQAYFHITNSTTFGEFSLSTLGTTLIGIGVRQAANPSSGFTANQKLVKLNVSGFYYNVMVDNAYDMVYDQVQSQNGTEGFWCQPDSSGSGGYFNTHVHLNCLYNANKRNLYYEPSVYSRGLTFISGAIQDATGSVAQCSMANVINATFIDTYGEGASTIPWLQGSGLINFKILGASFNASCGPLNLGTNATALLKGVYASSATAVLAGTTSTQKITIEDSTFPTSGNIITAGMLAVKNSTINGIYYSDTSTEQMSVGTGFSPSGIRFDRQTNTMAYNASATVVYQFLDMSLSINTNGSIAGRFYVTAKSSIATNDQTVYELSLQATSNGSTDATLTTVYRQVGAGTDVGTSSTPFTLVNDNGVVPKLEFTPNASLGSGTVTVNVAFMGILL